ncbi:hypothetical protein [Achromobacter xylosoxidans]|uniref:hypothetical protein n=1 Tax=Alcaligenes xylosoxydans xylosoxydans TaxID=85698 RepID=UPI0012DFDA35|nr:hypothetical protein [Achromobacter xylosoxidans]
MNSPIKLPPPSFYQKHEDVCGDEVGPPTPFWNQTAVEQAVRDALAEAAAICNRKFRAMAADGYPREASTARRLTAQIEALIPENNHE